MDTIYYVNNFLLAFVLLLCACLAQVQCTPPPHHEAKVCDQKSTVVVTFYSASWCGWCVIAEKFLIDNNILFVKRDIDNPENLKLLQEDKLASGYKKDINVVPMFVIGTEIIVGYDPVGIMAAIEKEALARWMILSQR